jgi:hypothetical protein
MGCHKRPPRTGPPVLTRLRATNCRSLITVIQILARRCGPFKTRSGLLYKVFFPWRSIMHQWIMPGVLHPGVISYDTQRHCGNRIHYGIWNRGGGREITSFIYGASLLVTSLACAVRKCLLQPLALALTTLFVGGVVILILSVLT